MPKLGAPAPSITEALTNLPKPKDNRVRLALELQPDHGTGGVYVVCVCMVRISPTREHCLYRTGERVGPVKNDTLAGTILRATLKMWMILEGRAAWDLVALAEWEAGAQDLQAALRAQA